MGIILLLDLAHVSPEDVAHKLEILRGFEHQLASVAFGDLDVSLENVVILETSVEGSDGHGLRDGAEVEHTLFLNSGEVEQTIVGTP